jgi:hypothetical protein
VVSANPTCSPGSKASTSHVLHDVYSLFAPTVLVYNSHLDLILPGQLLALDSWIHCRKRTAPSQLQAAHSNDTSIARLYSIGDHADDACNAKCPPCLSRAAGHETKCALECTCQRAQTDVHHMQIAVQFSITTLYACGRAFAMHHPCSSMPTYPAARTTPARRPRPDSTGSRSRRHATTHHVFHLVSGGAQPRCPLHAGASARSCTQATAITHAPRETVTTSAEQQGAAEP